MWSLIVNHLPKINSYLEINSYYYYYYYSILTFLTVVLLHSQLFGFADKLIFLLKSVRDLVIIINVSIMY